MADEKKEPTLTLTPAEAKIVDTMFAYFHSSYGGSVEGLGAGETEVVFEFSEEEEEERKQARIDGTEWDALNEKIAKFLEAADDA